MTSKIGDVWLLDCIRLTHQLASCRLQSQLQGWPIRAGHGLWGGEDSDFQRFQLEIRGGAFARMDVCMRLLLLGLAAVALAMESNARVVRDGFEAMPPSHAHPCIIS